MPFPSINAGGLECLSWLGLSQGLWREKEGRGGGRERKGGGRMEDGGLCSSGARTRVCQEKSSLFIYLTPEMAFSCDLGIEQNVCFQYFVCF